MKEQKKIASGSKSHLLILIPSLQSHLKWVELSLMELTTEIYLGILRKI
jgi:hypothetical protein